MTKFALSLIFLPLCFTVFSQNVDRNPQKTVKSDNQATREKAKDDSASELDIVEDYRRTTIHADGSKTIVVRFTEVNPNQYVKSDQEQQRVALSTMSWIKADLLIYISSLENKRVAVSQKPEQHSLALSNGWYDFLDSVILEARALLNNL
jgi:predicted solute-binding protein